MERQQRRGRSIFIQKCTRSLVTQRRRYRLAKNKNYQNMGHSALSSTTLDFQALSYSHATWINIQAYGLSSIISFTATLPFFVKNGRSAP